MELAKNLARLRRAAGMTQAQAAEYLSRQGLAVTHKAVSKWEQGASRPDGLQLLYLCRLYGVRDLLVAFDGAGEKDLLSGLNATGRARAAEYIRLLRGDEAFALHPSAGGAARVRTLPLYDMPVSAGTGLFLDSDHYELLEAPNAPAEANFAVRVRGDSMQPRFVDGQVVFVRQQQTLEDGEIGIFLLNGDAFCKKFQQGEVCYLLSLNPQYAPIPIRPQDELRMIGRVVG